MSEEQAMKRAEEIADAHGWAIQSIHDAGRASATLADVLTNEERDALQRLLRNLLQASYVMLPPATAQALRSILAKLEPPADPLPAEPDSPLAPAGDVGAEP